MFVNAQGNWWDNLRDNIRDNIPKIREHIEKVPKIPDYPHWTKVQFQKGDVLECQLVIPLARHVLLATSDRDVIHMVGDQMSFKGHVREESWQNYHDREGEAQNKCRNAGDYGRRFTKDEAVERARQWKGKNDLYFSLNDCNCEHWVNYWIKDQAVSNQLGFLSLKSGPRCDI